MTGPVSSAVAAEVIAVIAIIVIAAVITNITAIGHAAACYLN